MKNLHILNSKEVKQLREKIVEQFGTFFSGEYAFLQSKKNKIYLVSRDLGKIALENLIIERVGLYVAEVNEAEVRLSKEGAQLLGKEKGLKNVISLTKEELKAYFYGVDVKKDLGTASRMILLQYKKDIIGCAKYKEGKILNYLPKIHRGEVIL